MKRTKSTLTTGEAARLSGLTQRTIIDLIDRGFLKGYRIPGSKHRRIPRANLLAMMDAHGIPLPEGESAPLQPAA